MYKFFIDMVQMPVAPKKLEVISGSNNKTVDLVTGGQINLLKLPQLTQIKVSFLLPYTSYPFAEYPDGFKDIQFYLDLFAGYKNKKKPFRLTIARTLPDGDILYPTSMRMSIEDSSVLEDAEELGFDSEIRLTLKRYVDIATPSIEIQDDGKGKLTAISKKDRPVTKEIPTTVQVSQGANILETLRRTTGGFENIYEMIGDKDPANLSKGMIKIAK